MSGATAATDTAIETPSDDSAGDRDRAETEGEDEVADGASVDITRKPTRVASVAAALAALVAVFAGAAAPAGLAFGAVGALALAAALVLGHRTAADVGAVALFFGVVAGGLEATPVAATIVGTIATVLAWDFAHTAIDVGEQLGREARTIRLEAVAIVSSLLVGLVTGTIGYAVYVAGAGSQPVAAVVLLLVAGLLVTVGLGSGRDGSGTRRSGRSSRSRRR
ncbi:DUF7519 family protein [Halopiger xanaduensis]|uniref:Uncharacterized protein n=1 Tax=Halopiger xanaduensis (strain DSM 18323 / JCM 14033 / SH-6) TaxID=797210 RepID=F8D655_HALXS|nr:hypothetical protein [Halopiger xanaduensis]AEH35386.1 hypothetical protein Halxa_0747 [Halopiger xanaduensis SH-6]